MAERLRVREIDDDDGWRLVRIRLPWLRIGVTWRRAQMLLLSAQGMEVPAIAKVDFTGEDRVRDVIRNFNAGGFGSLSPSTRAVIRRGSRHEGLRTLLREEGVTFQL